MVPVGPRVDRHAADPSSTTAAEAVHRTFLTALNDQDLEAAERCVDRHGQATGTAHGRLHGAPATHRRYRASYFYRVRIADGLIVERVQRADVRGQMRQLYGRGLGAVGLSATLWRLPAG